MTIAEHDSLVFLLPERRRFAGQSLSQSFRKRLGRAQLLHGSSGGEQHQLERSFTVSPSGWPLAAICRQADVGDANASSWLFADPSFVRPEFGGARLMACGNLSLTQDESNSFIEALQPSFAEVGMALVSSPSTRWYVKLTNNTKFPDFTSPDSALGSDVFDHLPAGSDGRSWRALFNDAQIILHNHPRNAARINAGLSPVNSLWFWGGGRLPERVTCRSTVVFTEDVELRALSAIAGVACAQAALSADLVDCRRERDWAMLEMHQFDHAWSQLGARYKSILLDFSDGTRWLFIHRQRLRFWCRSARSLA